MSNEPIYHVVGDCGEALLLSKEEQGSGGFVIRLELRENFARSGTHIRFSSNDVSDLRDALEPYDLRVTDEANSRATRVESLKREVKRLENDEINSRVAGYGERYRSVITPEPQSDDTPAYGGTDKDDLISYEKWLNSFTTKFLSNLDELESEEEEFLDEEEENTRSYADGEFTVGDKVEFLGITGTVINVSATYGWQVPVQFDERKGTFSYINSLDLEKIDE